MMINEVHCKLGHIAYPAVCYAINTGKVTGIELDQDLKPKFCKVCAKVKSAKQPFLKESKTHAMKYGKRVHWDLWGPATIKSINGHSYVAA
jgi:hypothetical protein